MSLQTRLSALITAVGADIKELKARTPTILGTAAGPPLSGTSEPAKAVEWYYSAINGGGLLAKIGAVNPSPTTRGELWMRVSNGLGTSVVDRLIMGSDGNSDLLPPIVSSLPVVSPGGGALFHGQECYYSPEASTVWHLKYSTGTSKWYFVGGPPLWQAVDTAEGIGTAGSFVALATAGPSITIPVAGDYDVEIGFSGYAAGVGNALRMSYSIGATAAVTADQALFETKHATAYTEAVSRPRRKIGLAAGAALVSKYQATTLTGGPTFQFRWMRVTPVRLG